MPLSIRVGERELVPGRCCCSPWVDWQWLWWCDAAAQSSSATATASRNAGNTSRQTTRCAAPIPWCATKDAATRNNAAGAHGSCVHAGHRATSEHMRQRIAAHQQRQSDSRHPRKQFRVPQWRAFRTRRRVAAIRQPARIAQSHRHDRDAQFIVEGVAVHLQPGAQPIAGWIVEREAGFVDRRAGRLAHDQQPGRGGATEHRPRPKRQVRRAHAAGTDFGTEARQAGSGTRGTIGDDTGSVVS